MVKAEERRRYLRLTTPVDINYSLPKENKILRAVSKDISALGVRFETKEKIEVGTKIELTMKIPQAPNPVHAHGKLIWSKRVSLEDHSPYEVGVEFTRIEEDNKNTFLKYLCDLIYGRAHSK